MESQNKTQNKISKYSYVIAGTLLLLSTLGIGYSIQANRHNDQNIVRTSQSNQPQENKLKVTVQNQNGQSESFETKLTEDEKAIDALKRLDDESSAFSFSVKEYSFGAMVTSINGFEPDSSKQFWSFYVNNQMSSEGVSSYKLHKDDTFTFKLESIQ